MNSKLKVLDSQVHGSCKWNLLAKSFDAERSSTANSIVTGSSNCGGRIGRGSPRAKSLKLKMGAKQKK